MENIIRNNANREDSVQDWVRLSEQAFKSVMDVSTDTVTILSMTPSEGFHKKLDLIYSAEDMTTAEKIQAINQVEDKYAKDIERSTESYKGLMWLRVGLACSIFLGGVYAVSSPEGQRIIKSAMRKIA